MKTEVIYGITKALNTTDMDEVIKWVGFSGKSLIKGEKNFLWWRNFPYKFAAENVAKIIFWQIGIEAKIGPAINLEATVSTQEECFERGWGVYIEEGRRPMFSSLIKEKDEEYIQLPQKFKMTKWKGCGGAFIQASIDLPFPYHQKCYIDLQCTSCYDIRTIECECFGKKVKDPHYFNWRKKPQTFPTFTFEAPGGVFKIVRDGPDSYKHKRFKVLDIRPNYVTRFISKAGNGHACVLVECENCKKGKSVKVLSESRLPNSNGFLNKNYDEIVAATISIFDIAYRNRITLNDTVSCFICGEIIKPSQDMLKTFKKSSEGSFGGYEWTCPYCHEGNQLRGSTLKEGDEKEIIWDDLEIFCCKDCGFFNYKVTTPVFWSLHNKIQKLLKSK